MRIMSPFRFPLTVARIDESGRKKVLSCINIGVSNSISNSISIYSSRPRLGETNPNPNPLQMLKETTKLCPALPDPTQ